MDTRNESVRPVSGPPEAGHRKAAKALRAAGPLSAIAAFLAASCCVLPFVFIVLGLGGSWLTFLDYGLLYRQELQWLSAIVLALGWVFAIRQRRARRSLVRILLLATMLLAGSVLVWEFQGEIRDWLMNRR